MRVIGWLFDADTTAQAAIAQSPALTARQVLDRIQQHADGPWHGDTVDTIKAGDPETPVTGIATTFTDTYDVLERAVKAGANLIISHEPTFYNHLDETKALVNDPVYRAKLGYIQEHHLVVFRFHDHWHYPHMKQDGIMQGMVNALGWKEYQNSDNQMLFTTQSMTVAEASEINRREAQDSDAAGGGRSGTEGATDWIPAGGVGCGATDCGARAAGSGSAGCR